MRKRSLASGELRLDGIGNLSTAQKDKKQDCPYAANAKIVATMARSSAIRPLCYLIFFISGAAALVYEISWSRQIGLLFGHTAQAAAIVLSSYFVGMAVGCVIGARWASRGRPLLAYGIAEFAAAAWASLVPVVLGVSESATIAAWLNYPAPKVQMLARAAFCFFLLLPATAALGATLPLMAAFLASRAERDNCSQITHQVSLAYGLNTAGAVLGVVAATFLLLPVFGVRMSGHIAVGMSVSAGALAGILSLLGRESTGAENRFVQVVATPNCVPAMKWHRKMKWNWLPSSQSRDLQL